MKSKKLERIGVKNEKFLQKNKKCKLTSLFVGILPKLINVGRQGAIEKRWTIDNYKVHFSDLETLYRLKKAFKTIEILKF